MPINSYYPDESAQPGRLEDPDAEAGLWGTVHGTTRPTMAGFPDGVALDNIVYQRGEIAAAMGFEGAQTDAYLHEPAPWKYADESMDPGLTFEPEPSLEQHVFEMAGASYFPYMTKEPKSRQSDFHTVNEMTGNATMSPADSLGADESSMMRILFDF